MIGGVRTTATVTRTNNMVNVVAAGIEVTFAGRSRDGTLIPLDSDGNMRVEAGDTVTVDGSGFMPGSGVDVWMFSTPELLSTVKTDASGRIKESVVLPEGIEEGDHRFVLDGRSSSGQDALVGLGLIVGEESGGLSTAGKFLIALPIAFAVVLGLLIPTALRRRRVASGRFV